MGFFKFHFVGKRNWKSKKKNNDYLLVAVKRKHQDSTNCVFCDPTPAEK